MGERWNEGERKRNLYVCLCFSVLYECFHFLGVVLEILSMWLY